MLLQFIVRKLPQEDPPGEDFDAIIGPAGWRGLRQFQAGIATNSNHLPPETAEMD